MPENPPVVYPVAPVTLAEGDVGAIIIQVGSLSLCAPFSLVTLQAMANNMQSDPPVTINAQTVAVRMLSRVQEFVVGMRANLQQTASALWTQAFNESNMDPVAAQARYAELLAEFQAKLALQPLE